MTRTDFTHRANNELMHPSTMLYYKNLKKLLEARQTKAADITIRRRIRESQDLNNYQMEYDRIRAQLNQSVLKGESIPHLERRKKQLETSGAIAVQGLR